MPQKLNELEYTLRLFKIARNRLVNQFFDTDSLVYQSLYNYRNSEYALNLCRDKILRIDWMNDFYELFYNNLPETESKKRYALDAISRFIEEQISGEKEYQEKIDTQFFVEQLKIKSECLKGLIDIEMKDVATQRKIEFNRERDNFLFEKEFEYYLNKQEAAK